MSFFVIDGGGKEALFTQKPDSVTTDKTPHLVASLTKQSRPTPQCVIFGLQFQMHKRHCM